MVSLPWFIPQYRDVEDEVVKDDTNFKIPKRVNSEVDSVGILSDSDGDDRKLAIFEQVSLEISINSNTIVITEFRDEANRPWWKFFDEYEYRKPQANIGHQAWWRFRWFDKNYSPAEKKLLIKLDLTVGIYALLGYWVKYLDSANLNNAYISGLKEDIGMEGNDLINTQVIFLLGNIIFELPWIFLLPRVPIPYILFGCELVWAIFTLFTYKVNNPGTLKAFRFIIGASEAAFFPIFHYCALQWYKPHEIGSIGAIFYCGQFIGILTSGLLQGAASTIQNTRLSGWQWMFLIDGVISLAVAFLSVFLQPGTPSRCYSIWLTDDEIRLGRKRMIANGTDMSHTPKSFFNKKTWRNIFTSWHFWILGCMQMFGFNTNSASYGSFPLWLKSLNRYSTQHLNNLTTIPPALGIIWIFIVCVGADVTGKRFGFIFLSFVMNFISNIILAIWDVPESAKWAGYFLAYWSWSQSSVFNPLINDILRHDSNQKAIEWMILYILGLQSSAWIGRLVFPTTAAPRFFAGFLTCAVFSLAFNTLLVAAYFFYKRDERKSALGNGIFLYNSKTGIIPEEVRRYEEDGKTSSKESLDKKSVENVVVKRVASN